MQFQKTRGVVLRFIPFNDNHKIVKIYTEHFGLKSFIVSLSKSKQNRNKTALLQSLQPLWLEIPDDNSSKLNRLGEIRCAESINSILLHHTKRSVLLFLNEVLYKVLKEEQSDTALFGFIIQSIAHLNNTEGNCNNFHLVFLTQLTRYLGFKPVSNYDKHNKFFYFHEGRFNHFKSGDNYMMGEQYSQLFAQLLSLDYETMGQIFLNTETRVKLLENILLYYSLHIPEFKNIKSLEVLSEVHTA
ncbi:MAG: DNA repair protein RecO [Bacteroidia bacterium]|nr:DNA repair protein RecO [Bacteroidia bacterium]